MKNGSLRLLAAGLFLGAIGVSAAPLYWNPSTNGSYSGTGGDGAWQRQGTSTDWWTGSADSNFSDNQSPIFEGQGNVTIGTGTNSTSGYPRTSGVTIFRNLTGNYTFTNLAVLQGITLEASVGSNDVTFASGTYLSAGSNRVMTNNSAGLLTINGFTRQLGSSATSVTFSGSGNFALTGNGGNTAGSLTKNGTGRLTVTASTASFDAGLILNDGELFMNGNADLLTWNGGALVYDLSAGNLSNTINLAGAFARGSGSSFLFDFGGTGLADETYTLLTFAATDFLLGDFSAVNAPAGGRFILDSTSLTYAVPEPSALGMLSGVIVIGWFAAARRFRR